MASLLPSTPRSAAACLARALRFQSSGGGSSSSSGVRRLISTARTRSTPAALLLRPTSGGWPAGRYPPACRVARSFATSPQRVEERQYTIADIDEHAYAPLAERMMTRLHDALEELVEGPEGEEGGWEVEYSSGVLTLSLGDRGTYVVNKQPPNRQIWLSSPLSGPKRYNYDASHGVWFDARDPAGAPALAALLERELTAVVGRAVMLGE